MTLQEKQSLYELAGECYRLLSELIDASNSVLMKTDVPAKDRYMMELFIPRIVRARNDVRVFRLCLKPE